MPEISAWIWWECPYSDNINQISRFVCAIKINLVNIFYIEYSVISAILALLGGARCLPRADQGPDYLEKINGSLFQFVLRTFTCINRFNIHLLLREDIASVHTLVNIVYCNTCRRCF